MRATSFAIPVVSLLAGCLPSRDNPRDPANAPAPVLRVVNRTGPSGCLADESAGEWQSLTLATRATCLALDARETDDPQGTPLGDLTFTFERVDDETSPEPIGTPLLREGEGEALYLLPESIVDVLPIGTESAFRVTVEDPGGGRGFATAHVTLLNSAPVVRTAPPILLPVHGRPWEPVDTAIEVTLRARADDGEQDPITSWRWTAADGTPYATETSSLVVSIDVSAPGMQQFFVTASDGTAVSEVARALVSVGDPPLWGGIRAGSDDFDGARRIGSVRLYDDLYQGSTSVNVFGTTSIRSVNNGSRLLFMAGILVLASFPELEVLDFESPAGFSQQASVADVSGDHVWIATAPLGIGPYTRELARYDLQGGNGILPDVPLVTIDSDPGFEDTYISTDLSGNLWVTGRFESRVRALSDQGVVLGTALLPAGTGFRGLSSRPGSGEMWAIAGQSLESEIAQPAVIRLMAAGATVSSDVFPLGTGDADGLAWIDDDRFWSYLGERGMCLVDAVALETNGVDAAIEICHPTASSFSLSARDPSGEGAWFSAPSGSIGAFVDPLSMRTFDAGADPQTVDGAGRLWFSREGYAVSGELAADGVSAGVSSYFVTAAPDGMGGLWTINASPRSLTRVGSDGSVLDFVTELDLGGGDIRTVPLTLVATSDGVDHLYLASVFDLEDLLFSFLEVDVSQRGPSSSPRVPARILEEVTVFPSFTWGVSPPGTSRYLWWVQPFGVGSGLQRTPLDGSGTQLVLGGDANDTGAISPVTGNVCWVDYVDFNTFELLLVTSAGGPTLLETIDAPAAPFDVAASVTAGYDPLTREETCWIATTEQTLPRTFRLQQYDSTGILRREYIDTPNEGESLSLAATADPGTLWLLRTDEIGVAHLEVIQWDLLGNPARLDLGETEFSRLFR